MLMKIIIDSNSSRKAAWTDKKNGYLELNFSKDIKNSGYFRGQTQYLSGFSCAQKKWNSADYTEIFPYGFRSIFGEKILEVSLLLDEQAFYINSSNSVEILDSVKFNSDSEKKLPSWKTFQKDGITILSSDCGLSVAANFNFYHSVKEKDLILHATDSKNLSKSEEPFSLPGFYVTFEETQEKAEQKAERLAKQNAILNHTQKIDKFLSQAKIQTEDERFNDSVLWARFNAWLLTTQDHCEYTGIWAGLPWFRDNWGRDTFISLCGTLLVSGCFEEAKNVLLGFAKFQCLEKDSPSYGRIPNRYRNKEDVIYNTADGTLWFIRALYEYAQYSGDQETVSSLLPAIEIALDAEILHCDQYGFLKHGDADTWMDARIQNENPISPRGDRANDIQALWFTALKIGSILIKNPEKQKLYANFAQKVKDSFLKLFWNPTFDAFADALPEGGYGDWAKNMKVRPNQLFIITAPSCLPDSKENRLIPQNYAEKILSNVERELVSPFGLYSLCPSDPIFHPHHEWPEQYHKDAAYHNGTIWEWNSGPYISASAKFSTFKLQKMPTSILKNESKMILDSGCAGSLSENIHACPDKNGNPILSGTYSQSWSLAEFNRNVIQDILGFCPRLLENRILLNPHLPIEMQKLNAELPFGKNQKIFINLEKKSRFIEAKISFKNLSTENKIENLILNEQNLKADEELILKFQTEKNSPSVEKFATPKKWCTKDFPEHDLFPEWNGASHKKDYLFNLILSGRTQSKNCAGTATPELEWLFDSPEFSKKYKCTQNLGAIYSTKNTTFRLWAPTAQEVSVVLFGKNLNENQKTEFKMKKLSEPGFFGVWECSVNGDLHGNYYQFKVYVNGLISYSPDPYARACGVNGLYSMVCDFLRTNPEGWEKSNAPTIKSPCDVVAYELHVADLTSSPTWNGSEKNRRTFLGCAEQGTTFDGIKTGFDHLKELGITHVQFLPIFDFRSVDESRIHDSDYKNQVKFGLFNWGYDPENYACPEGSYSTNPYDGETRIRELKQMIKTFNDNGIGVIMDVVYNHVNDGIHHPFNLCVPGYYYRVEGYSGAGEDTASEHEMFRQYMIKTLSWWLKEYKLSGFRFDLMGLHDAETMNQIHAELSKIKSDVLLYGEGWDMYNAEKMQSASMKNAQKMPFIGHFNDAFRCAIKGPVSVDDEAGFIQNGSRKESVKFGIVGATEHPDVDFSKVIGTVAPNAWGNTTWKSVNYTEIHDNITLHDKIEVVEPNHNDEYYVQMQKFALALVLLSEGMPILHAGMEFLRTKQIPDEIWKNEQPLYETATTSDGKKHFFKNTYNICDKINGLDWSRLKKYKNVSDYVKNLIQIRKEHPSFKLEKDTDVQQILKFEENKNFNFPKEVLIWTLDGSKCNDSWKKITLIANPLSYEINFSAKSDKNLKTYAISNGKEIFSEPKELELSEQFEIPPKALAIFAQM